MPLHLVPSAVFCSAVAMLQHDAICNIFPHMLGIPITYRSHTHRDNVTMLVDLSMDLCIYGSMDLWIYGSMYVWIYGYMDLWIYGYMDIWTYEWIYGIHRSIWIYAYMHVCIRICMYMYVYVSMHVCICICMYMYVCV